jgi:hypothetical protein
MEILRLVSGSGREIPTIMTVSAKFRRRPSGQWVCLPLFALCLGRLRRL